MNNQEKVNLLTDTLAELQGGNNELRAKIKTQDAIIRKLREDSESLKIAKMSLSEIRQILNSEKTHSEMITSIESLILSF